MEKKEKLENSKPIVGIGKTISDIIYVCILIPLTVIALHIAYQIISEPDKIPDIFGYKMFIILDDSMDESVEYGELIFTKNVYTNDLKKDDLIAFRNSMNTVTIHKIIDIEEKIETENATNNRRTVKTFTMQTSENEANDTKFAKDDRVEGIIIKKIPRIGSIIYFIQKPIATITICVIILIIGIIADFIAKKLDEREGIETEKYK